MTSRSQHPKRLTIVVPAYCEAERLGDTVADVVAAAQATLDEFEVFVVNDGSTDGTRAVADEAAARFPNVTAIHFPVNRGVGAAFAAGLDRARFESISLVPGDRAFEREGLSALFAAVGTADMVISYRSNPETRTPVRLIMSRFYTLQMRATTRCAIRDGSSLFIWPVALTRSAPIPSDYTYHLVTMVRLLQSVSSYTELPVKMTPKPDHNSRVMNLRVILRLATSLSKLTLASVGQARGPLPRRVIQGGVD